ncbi:RnaseH-domain-containing protein [Gloeophyllum trabeum ATCC 11539]|uniref:ribonuclease H n=1 Tax=Gloeophyllum trabeum (strain ATCC 11539 / FP-39264 / Madison 617) TaxID=670483 RepID=S7RJX6_GLOTA|nr:RnaseH-domain-containing protein [Gloeophyllum trabeum ATCC 11539]EPQ52939.1 RnaseH-domain-containing protein [Gloeophyllum trabeum ATCC 11539]
MCHHCAEILQALPAISNPGHCPPDDNLTLTHHRLEKNHQARLTRDRITFNPTMMLKTSLAEVFRVFANIDAKQISLAYRLAAPAPGVNLEDEHITLYTDGSCEDNGKLTARTGAGIFVAPNHPLNRALRVPGPLQSNQVGELAAIIVALQLVDCFAPVTIISDSLYAIEGLTSHLGNWEDKGWINVSNAPFFQAAAYQLRLQPHTSSG